MPFDGSTIEQTLLVRLTALLRDKSQWPTDFKWNYCHLNSCALGLARAHFGECEVVATLHKNMVNNEAWKHLFAHVGSDNKMWMWHVRPEHVADAIEVYLGTREKVRKTMLDRVKHWF